MCFTNFYLCFNLKIERLAFCKLNKGRGRENKKENKRVIFQWYCLLFSPGTNAMNPPQVLIWKRNFKKECEKEKRDRIGKRKKEEEGEHEEQLHQSS